MKKQELPKDWRARLRLVKGRETATMLAKRLGITTKFFNELELANSEFRVEVFRVRRFPVTPSTLGELQRLNDMTADEIDELLIESIGLELKGLDAVIVLRMRDAIRQLRREKRELASEVGRLRHAEHLRRQGGTPTTHQHGNSVGTGTSG